MKKKKNSTMIKNFSSLKIAFIILNIKNFINKNYVEDIQIASKFL